MKKHLNSGDKTIPNYETLKEIIVKGTQRGGDTRQYVFLDDNRNECERTYNETWREICGIGTFYFTKNLKNGCKIAIIAENSFDWMIAYYATLISGNVTVPMDCKLSFDDLIDQLIRCECDALVYSKEFEQLVKMCQDNSEMPIKHYFPITEFENFKKIGYEIYDSGDTSIENVDVKPDDLACIVFTSGTTGKSKGVMLTHKNVASNCSSSSRVLSGRHAIGFLPLNHTYAWVSALFATYIVNQWGYMCKSIRDIPKDLKKYKPYNFSGVPLVIQTIYDKIYKTAEKSGRLKKLEIGLKISKFLLKFGIDKRRDLFKIIIDNLGGNLNMIICGGAFLDPKYEQGLRDFGIEVFNGYGITECSPAVTCSSPENHKLGSVGKPIDCCEIKIHNPDEYGVGEIYIRGTNVMKGYYNDPEATAAAFDGEWYKSGDFGRIDKDGFLFIVGRLKNLIVLSNGKNVSPEELEDKLSTINYVKEVLVYDEGGKITAEFFLNEEDYPDAREN